MEMNTLHLDEIVNWIDEAFGEAVTRAECANMDVLKKIFSDNGYQRYLQDQVNRQIIRDYLTNAVVLGVIPESGLAAFAAQVGTEDGRATLALYMLMSSIEEAADLPVASGDPEVMKRLRPVPESQPYIKLVPS